MEADRTSTLAFNVRQGTFGRYVEFNSTANIFRVDITLAAEGIEVTVVNCRFLKPMDATMLDALARNHRTFVTVEEGTVVNGFGAYLSERLQTAGPETRVIALGVPDKLIEQAPRAEQLAEFGLTAEGIARRISALVREETLEAR